MYKCARCGELFEEPNTYEEYGITYGECPHCGSEELTELEQCKGCHEWTKETFGGLCRFCIGDAIVKHPKETYLFLKDIDALDEFAEYIKEEGLL